MIKPKNYNPKNERLKREFVQYLRDAEGFSETTVKGTKAGLARFETFTRLADFDAFSVSDITDFKKRLFDTGLSRSTISHTLHDLKRFYSWLSQKPGYKSKINLHHTAYFRLTAKDERIAKAEKFAPFATMEQFKQAITRYPSDTLIDRRDRALLALALLTGARDGAIISLRLKHIDLTRNLLKQESDLVKTKNSKTINTFFVPICDDVKAIFTDYVKELKEKELFGNDDPLFPKTRLIQDKDYHFKAAGLTKEFWANASPVREIFKKAFKNIGLEYFKPHSVRKTLTQYAEQICKTPEEFKAFSQNIGHESPLTTFNSYGNVSVSKQQELIANLGKVKQNQSDMQSYKLDAILTALKKNGLMPSV